VRLAAVIAAAVTLLALAIATAACAPARGQVPDPRPGTAAVAP
jgi:hypothetical protein